MLTWRIKQDWGYGLFILGLLALSSVGVALFVNLPGSIVQELIVILVITGIVLTVTSYVAYRSRLLAHLRSLQYVLLLIVLVTVGVVLFDLWVLTRLMLLSTHYLSLITTLMFFAALTAVSVGYFIARSMTERIRALRDLSDRVARSNFAARVPVVGNDELADLAQRFNEMACSLEQAAREKALLEETRRDLIAWVSHDLRTPLTSIRVMLEALADGVIVDDDTQQRYLSNSLKEIEHLNQMIGDLFELAQLDTGKISLDKMSTSLRDLLSDTLGSMQAKAERKQLQLHAEIAAGIDLVEIAPDKIQRVFKNLLDNAIQYTPEGNSVSIAIERDADQTVRVKVVNTGVSIPHEQLPSLFDSFYRGEASRAMRSDRTRGAGLGLAIARGFVQAHGGSIWAESQHEPPQTQICFTLPPLSAGHGPSSP